MARPKGIPCSEEHKAKLRAINIANGAVNRLRSPEAKLKLTATYGTEQFRAACKEARGTEEQRQKTSEHSKSVWAALTPEQRQARTQGMRNSPKRVDSMLAALKSDKNRKRAGVAWSRRWAAFSEEEKKTFTLKSSVKMTATMRQKWAAYTEEEKDAFVSGWHKGIQRSDTSIERMIAGVLNALRVVYETQKKIGRWSLDFYVPHKNLDIECDGTYWHSRPNTAERDIRRDAYMQARGITVLRLPEADIRSGASAAVVLKAVS